ncbi:MAG: sugar phosphate nucleotidyltransferase [candidate division WOR-3 bacterium]|nr:sugar phosphate nucleotidyltransferase [candidate division WOR-3 bacterium]
MLKVIIPAAGEGRRLKPHTQTTPKVLLKVAGKPILGHILDRIISINPDEIIVIVGSQGKQIQDFLTKNYPQKFQFVEQQNPMGLGDAIYRVSDYLQSEPVLILLGDTILDLDFSAFIGKENLVGIKPVSTPQRFGIVETRSGYVTRITEKPLEPKSNLALVGIYYFTNAQPLFDNLRKIVQEGRKTRGEYQLSDALQEMIEQGIKIKTFPVEYWLDCGTPEALITTNRYLLQSNHYFTPREKVVIIPPVYIDDSAIIEESVIGPFVSISEQVEIRNSIIRDSIINQDSYVENCLLEGSILSENAVVRERARKLNLGAFSEMELG